MNACTLDKVHEDADDDNADDDDDDMTDHVYYFFSLQGSWFISSMASTTAEKTGKLRATGRWWSTLGMHPFPRTQSLDSASR